jgi:hypothetical protein
MKRCVFACLLIIFCGGISACGTFAAYDETDVGDAGIAVVVGDYRFRAGAPVSLYLRKVDKFEIPMQDHAARVPAGKHTLLVDCTIAETDSITRHEVEVDLLGGYTYRLRADTEPGMRGCTNVHAVAD